MVLSDSMYPSNSDRSSAINEFHRARNQATFKEIIARISGKSTELLSYEEVRQKLRAQKGVERGLHDIPLESIVGSVGRYTDFTRDFLPRNDTDQDRWAGVKLAVQGLPGLEPIEVYQLGDVYFVIDGNHRVSIARQFSAKTIQAYVTEVKSRVSLTPDVQPDDLIIKSEYVSFLENTHLDETHPKADLSVTAPGKYPILEEHIDVHRYYLGKNQQREVPYPEAAADWYENIYLPVIEAIQKSGILRYFPNRTESDLYLWIAQYQQELKGKLGWSIRFETAVANLSNSLNSGSFLTRIGKGFLDRITPTRLESGPKTGQWRQVLLKTRSDERLFADILVPINGKESGWFAFNQAVIIAQQEGAALHGLHIVPSIEEINSPEALSVKSNFERQCMESGIEGQLIIVSGDITDEICNRSLWTDLIVVNLLHPPGSQVLERLDSGFQELIQRSPRPILATPRQATHLKHALLAYDGSTKSDEALFVSAYLAQHWDTNLSVVTVFDNNRIKPETLLRAEVYLDDHGVKAQYFAKEGKITENLLQVIMSNDFDLIIMGGYGYRPVIQVVLGSTVDQILRESKKPMLICR